VPRMRFKPCHPGVRRGGRIGGSFARRRRGRSD
jgi:hypothetical protein